MGLGVVVAAVVVVGLLIAAPWKSDWQKSVADYLAGSWCTPMSGDAVMRTDFMAAGAAAVTGEVHFSHYPRVDRFAAEIALTEDGFTLTWTAPETFVELGPTTYQVVNETQIALVPNESSPDGRIMTRCALENWR